MKFVPIFFVLAMLVVGCDSAVTDKIFVRKPGPQNPQPPTPIVTTFDAAVAADELANQAAISGNSIAEDSSEVINGTLELGRRTNVFPEDFVKKVREAVPGLTSHPPRDLTTEEIDKIRAVR